MRYGARNSQRYKQAINRNRQKMKKTEEGFPIHRDPYDIRRTLTTLRKAATMAQGKPEERRAQQAVLEAELELAEAELFNASIAQMHVSVIDDEYFIAMRLVREKQVARITVRHKIEAFKND